MRTKIAPGTRLGPYEIQTLLGSGGMGVVYRAHDTRLHRDVAVKVLPDAFVGDKDRMRRFEQEARATGQLNHPYRIDIATGERRPYREISPVDRTGPDTLTSPRGLPRATRGINGLPARALFQREAWALFSAG